MNSILIDKTGDLDIPIPMYDLLEHSDKHSMTWGVFWSYYRDKIVNDDIDVNDDTLNGKSFKYKRKL